VCQQRGDGPPPAPARGLGHRLAEHRADVLPDPRLGIGQVDAHRRGGRLLAEAVARVDRDAPREQRDHDLLRARAAARDVERAGEPALRSGGEPHAVHVRQRLLEVGEVRADRRLG
jgi:hypothetical protein